MPRAATRPITPIRAFRAAARNAVNFVADTPQASAKATTDDFTALNALIDNPNDAAKLSAGDMRLAPVATKSVTSANLFLSNCS